MKSAAFTLVEVLIALAVFAIAATVLSSSASNAIYARMQLEENRQKTSDMRLVRQHVLGLTIKEKVEQGGQFETAFHDSLDWDAELEPTSIMHLYQLTLSVHFEDETEVQTLYVLRPDFTDASQNQIWLQDAQERVEDARPLL